MSGLRTERLKPLLENQGSMDALATVAEKLAEGNVPPAVAQALAQARLTALQKPGGAGVWGIATGDTLRRLVARTLAQQFGTAISRACAPYQFAGRVLCHAAP